MCAMRYKLPVIGYKVLVQQSLERSHQPPEAVSWGKMKIRNLPVTSDSAHTRLMVPRTKAWVQLLGHTGESLA